MRKLHVHFIVFVAVTALGACAHEPTGAGERSDLVHAAKQTLARMEARDPSLRSRLDRSAGYVVFPQVGAGGLLVGGGAGDGVVFQHGRRTNFAVVEHASVGAVAGGAQFAELVIVNDPAALEEMKQGRFDLGTQASAVMLRSGAAETAGFEKGVAVFIEPLRGAMVNASLSGQRIRFTM